MSRGVCARPRWPTVSVTRAELMDSGLRAVSHARSPMLHWAVQCGDQELRAPPPHCMRTGTGTGLARCPTSAAQATWSSAAAAAPGPPQLGLRSPPAAHTLRPPAVTARLGVVQDCPWGSTCESLVTTQVVAVIRCHSRAPSAHGGGGGHGTLPRSLCALPGPGARAHFPAVGFGGQQHPPTWTFRHGQFDMLCGLAGSPWTAGVQGS